MASPNKMARGRFFSGCRISEARQVLWQDVDWERGEIKVRNAKRSRTSNAHELRFVPIIPPMRELLERLQREQKPEPTDRVCLVGECEKALTAACGVKDGRRLTRIRRGREIQLGIGIERITHHDLRHLFATRCIEAGVDIPTVSRWLGHVDGGALARNVRIWIDGRAKSQVAFVLQQLTERRFALHCDDAERLVGALESALRGGDLGGPTRLAEEQHRRDDPFPGIWGDLVEVLHAGPPAGTG